MQPLNVGPGDSHPYHRRMNECRIVQHLDLCHLLMEMRGCVHYINSGLKRFIHKKYTRIGLYCRMSPYHLGAWDREVAFFRWKVKEKAWVMCFKLASEDISSCNATEEARTDGC